MTLSTIRRRADTETRADEQQTTTIERARYLSWWHGDDTTFYLEGQLSAAQGHIVALALERVAPDIPHDPGAACSEDARRADALVAGCSGHAAAKPTVVVHTTLDALQEHSDHHCELESDGVAPAHAARRLTCDARIQLVLHDEADFVIGVGRASDNLPAWLRRQLTHRDRTCTFPGCERRTSLHAHHLPWWHEGGPADLDNLTLVCPFHHKLVHEFGWRVAFTDTPGVMQWIRPNGQVYVPGPAPPDRAAA